MARIDDILSGAELVSKSVGQPHQLMQMIYSDPGAGKTILGSKLAKLICGNGKVLHLDSHQGFVSLQEKQWENLRKGIVTRRIDDPKDLAALGDAFLNKHRKVAPFSVVILDELSAWVKIIAMDYVRAKNHTGPDDLLPAIEGSDWNPIGYIVADILGRFMRAGVHVIVLAHSREKGDRDGGSKKYSPNFTPLMNIDIQGIMHQTTLLTSRIAGRNQYERELYTRPTASIQAKTRVEGMPAKPTEKQFLQLTAKWVLGEQPDEGTASAADLVTGKKDKTERIALPEDAPLPGDELDDEDQPVIVSETTEK